MPEPQSPPSLTFGLLGPVQAWLAGAELHLGPPQQRSILVMLLLREGGVATLDELIEGMWRDKPPHSAVTTIRTYMWRLRRILHDTGVDVTTRLDSAGGGYLLRTPRDAIDVSRFGRHTARGAEAASRGDWLTTVAELSAALKLSRGQPLAGTLGPYVESQRLRLQQLVAAVQVDLLGAMVALGRHAEVLPELAAMAAAHPLREDLQGLLMTALYGSGRVAEALQQYQKTRRALIDDLGVEPGIQLRAVHRRILAGDLSLVTVARGPGTAPTGGLRRRPPASRRRLVREVVRRGSRSSAKTAG